jgi:hypothetical protein
VRRRRRVFAHWQPCFVCRCSASATPLSEHGAKSAYLKITAWPRPHSLGFMRPAFPLRMSETTQLCAFCVALPKYSWKRAHGQRWHTRRLLERALCMMGTAGERHTTKASCFHGRTGKKKVASSAVERSKSTSAAAGAGCHVRRMCVRPARSRRMRARHCSGLGAVARGRRR